MEESKMSYDKLCYTLAQLNAESQEDFLKQIEHLITEEEKKALLFGISYFRMLQDEKLSNAIKAVLAETLYKEFNRK